MLRRGGDGVRRSVRHNRPTQSRPGPPGARRAQPALQHQGGRRRRATEVSSERHLLQERRVLRGMRKNRRLRPKVHPLLRPRRRPFPTRDCLQLALRAAAAGEPRGRDSGGGGSARGDSRAAHVRDPNRHDVGASRAAGSVRRGRVAGGTSSCRRTESPAASAPAPDPRRVRRAIAGHDERADAQRVFVHRVDLGADALQRGGVEALGIGQRLRELHGHAHRNVRLRFNPLPISSLYGPSVGPWPMTASSRSGPPREANATVSRTPPPNGRAGRGCSGISGTWMNGMRFAWSALPWP